MTQNISIQFLDGCVIEGYVNGHSYKVDYEICDCPPEEYSDSDDVALVLDQGMWGYFTFNDPSEKIKSCMLAISINACKVHGYEMQQVLKGE